MQNAPPISPPLQFEVTKEVQPDSRDAVANGLRAFNRLHLGDYDWVPLDVYVRDCNGNIIGGLIGDIALGWLSIHALWVAEDLRGLGLGTRILEAAEAAAIEDGCRAAILDTLSFQAPAFYEKRGYTLIGVVENYRGGSQRVFMQKRLLPDT